MFDLREKLVIPIFVVKNVLAKKINKQTLQSSQPELLFFKQPLPFVFIDNEAFWLKNNYLRNKTIIIYKIKY